MRSTPTVSCYEDLSVKIHPTAAVVPITGRPAAVRQQRVDADDGAGRPRSSYRIERTTHVSGTIHSDSVGLTNRGDRRRDFRNGGDDVGRDRDHVVPLVTEVVERGLRSEPAALSIRNDVNR